jgi:hypothetical protein
MTSLMADTSNTQLSQAPDKGQRNKHSRINRKNLQQPIYIVILSISSNKTKTPKLSSCILLLNLTTLAHRCVAIAANRKYTRRSSIPPYLRPRSQQTYYISHPTPLVLSPTREHSGTQKESSLCPFYPHREAQNIPSPPS